MDANTVKTMFYASQGVYAAELGVGNLLGHGYKKVSDSGFWYNDNTGFKAQSSGVPVPIICKVRPVTGVIRTLI